MSLLGLNIAGSGMGAESQRLSAVASNIANANTLVGSQLLCVLGTAGIGKTMIASYLVDQIEVRAKRSPSTLFLYFFCDNKDETRRKSKKVLRSLLIQLLQQQPSFFEHVQPEYEEMGDQLRNNFNSLRNIFLAILPIRKRSWMFILIDALDECEND